jgi:peptidoglycan glycosyltransferase
MMILDYKDISFSFKEKRKKTIFKRLKYILLVFILLGVVFQVFNFLDNKKIDLAQNLLLQSKTAEAQIVFDKIKESWLHRSKKKELQGLFLLFTNQIEAGENYFKELKQSSKLKAENFLSYFSDQAEYQKLKIYTQFVEISHADKAVYYTAIYKTALYERRDAEITLTDLKKNKSPYDKQIEILQEINQSIAANKIEYVFDTNGQPLAYFDIAAQKTVSLTAGFSFDLFNTQIKQGIRFFKLTIDKAIQQSIHQLFKNYFGTFLLINLVDSSIIAAYSKPADSAEQNTVFSEHYEPGSVMKLITLFSYFENEIPSVFPYECQGNMAVKSHHDKELFYDWTRHGQVISYSDAMALSCNLSFASMGLALGVEKLKNTLNSFLFDRSGLLDSFIPFEFGTIRKDIATEYQLANLAVGLEEISITTFHAAVVAAIFAQHGSILKPYMVKNIKNLFQLGFYNSLSQKMPLTMAATHMGKIKESMIEVINHPQGTGRRAKLSFITPAIKTGTAGKKENGLDAIVLGFFPADSPKYAFAFRIERGGKAELAGAALLKEFLKTLYQPAE